MSDFIGDKECVTHHYACACRESIFKKQREIIAVLRSGIDELIDERMAAYGKFYNELECPGKIALKRVEELEK